MFPSDSPGFYDDLVLVDSTPVECARSIEITRRSQLADAADYGYCASHSRYFCGLRLHGLFALDGTPPALMLTSPKPNSPPSIPYPVSFELARPATMSRPHVFLRILILILASFALLTDELPGSNSTPVKLEIIHSGSPTIGSALLRILKAIPSALVLPCSASSARSSG